MTDSAQAQPMRDVAADVALTDWRGLAAAGAIAAIACDLLHEFAHAAVAMMPLGVETLVISTIGTTTHGSSPIVALAGPVANLLLSATLLLAGSSRISPTWRYFAWLFGTFNLFDALAYLGYSAALGSGDWAVVFNAVADPATWRPIIGAAGLLLYAFAIFVSARVLGRWCLSVGADPRRVERLCFIPYWAGAIALIAGSLLNPAGRIYILTSGAATGLGAMLGLLLVPRLVARSRPENPTGTSGVRQPLRLGRGWTVSAAALGLVFILVFGPGVQL